MITYSDRREACPHLVQPQSERRPANALNVEIGTPSERCILKPPPHWRGKPSTLRWMASGGSPLVLGECNQNCPAEREDETTDLVAELRANRELFIRLAQFLDAIEAPDLLSAVNNAIGTTYDLIRHHDVTSFARSAP